MVTRRLRGRQLALVLPILSGIPVFGWTADASHKHLKQIVIPEADRFTPFALTVAVGDTVEWINQDTDDHRVVGDDAFNTVGKKLTGIDQLVPGTDNNGGAPGTFRLRFKRAGTFVYYCGFHAHIDAANQPVAPGPDGGIQDPTGNFGTPMMGVITVVSNPRPVSGTPNPPRY